MTSAADSRKASCIELGVRSPTVCRMYSRARSRLSGWPAASTCRLAGAQRPAPDSAVVPPKYGAFSTSVTRSPRTAAVRAATSPPAPEPTTTTSLSVRSFGALSTGAILVEHVPVVKRRRPGEQPFSARLDDRADDPGARRVRRRERPADPAGHRGAERSAEVDRAPDPGLAGAAAVAGPPRRRLRPGHARARARWPGGRAQLAARGDRSAAARPARAHGRD